MPKGKTNQPLRIFVHPDLWEAWKHLEDAGHVLARLTPGAGADADLIVGPNCHYFDRHLAPYMEDTLKWARGAKRKRLPDEKSV